ncbi:MAG TPA: transporter associated domain-containing protein, partial [Oligoflexia bacterium]|nr:transporter associated domain-containing protein [Oligoflexia bacterium]
KLLNELFDLTALSAQEVMIPRIHVSGVPLGAQPSEMKAIITADPHTRYPVFQDSIDNIKGMVHIKDLFRLIRAESPLQSKHLRQVLFVPATILLDTLIKRMNIEHTQFAVVVDEHGGTAGIVTLEDVFEEVVGGAGEPQGEGNTALQRRKRRRITGTTRVDELGEMFGIKLEHPEVVTVSGLVMAQLGRPAQVSDQIHYGGLNITVSQVKGLGVAECLVQLAARADDSTKSE